MIATVSFDPRLLPEYRDELAPTAVADARPVVAAPRARDLMFGTPADRAA